MTPQKRLDQIEPLFAEMLAKQDETSAKVERVSAQVRQLIVTTVEATTTQSDNIRFLIGKVQSLEQGQQDLRTETKQGFEQVKEDLRTEMKQGFEQVDKRIEQVQQELRTEMQQGFAQIAALIEKKG